MGFPHYFSSYKLSDGSVVNVNILDTAGTEKFRSLSAMYYRQADCCLLVYDITDEYSFGEIKEYFNDRIKELCKKNIQVILLGNKTDLEDKRKIPAEEGAKFCLENDYIFMETSCLKNTNVADAFETLIEITNREMIKNRNNNNNKKTILKINQIEDNNEKSSCYC